jgi:hypothetical protein
MKGAVLVGHIDKIRNLGVDADICVVASPGADVGALVAASGDYAAVPPNPDIFTKGSDPKIVVFTWRDGPTGRTPISKLELQDASSVVGTKILAAAGDGQLAMVALMTPTK